MEIRGRLFKFALASVLGFVALTGAQAESEASQYRYLCMSSPGACDYAPPDAPSLNMDVCYDGTTVTVMNGGTCPNGGWAFFVDTGEVIDPQTGEVAAYIALPDACELDYCSPHDPGDPPGTEGAMCCDPLTGDCVDTDAICSPDKIAVWCDDGEVAKQGNNGEWDCHES